MRKPWEDLLDGTAGYEPLHLRRAPDEDGRSRVERSLRKEEKRRGRTFDVGSDVFVVVGVARSREAVGGIGATLRDHR